VKVFSCQWWTFRGLCFDLQSASKSNQFVVHSSSKWRETTWEIWLFVGICLLLCHLIWLLRALQVCQTRHIGWSSDPCPCIWRGRSPAEGNRSQEFVSKRRWIGESQSGVWVRSLRSGSWKVRIVFRRLDRHRRAILHLSRWGFRSKCCRRYQGQVSGGSLYLRFHLVLLFCQLFPWLLLFCSREHQLRKLLVFVVIREFRIGSFIFWKMLTCFKLLNLIKSGTIM